MILLNILNNNYYIKYNFLFKYSYNKFNLINNNLLYNFSIKENFCNIIINNTDTNKYGNIVYKKHYNYNKNTIYKYNYNYNYLILVKLCIKSHKCLIITNVKQIVNMLYENKYNVDTLLYFNSIHKSTNKDLDVFAHTKEVLKKQKQTVSGIIYNNTYSLLDYKQFLINLKNNNEENNIYIPKHKYDTISCHIGYTTGLSLTASYKMVLEIPNIISSISMALKNIAKDGTLLLFWTIVNVNVPVIKKILSILSYGFKNIEIIDNDINQNLLIGVPEYYINCSGYKDNISNELINKLLDIAIETVEYTYDVCDVLDYYEDYTEKNPNHSLFYNKIDEEESDEEESKTTSNKKHTRKTKKISSSQLSSSTSSKPIKPIYYIEDINIPELDKIMKDSTLEFEVSLLMNKLEGLFIGYFKMVNNLIVNALTYDDDGVMIVKEEAIMQKDITNLTKLITMFEYNNLPYNKHALKVLLNKQDEILDKFYSLDIPVNVKLIPYGDNLSRHLNTTIFNNYSKNNGSSASYSRINDTIDTVNEFDVLYIYYNKIKLALQVKTKLVEDIDFNNYVGSIPKIVDYATYDFSIGLCEYLNIKYKDLPIAIDNSFAKLWEILYIFNIIPHNVINYKVLHLCETSGQQIICSKYWSSKYCPKLKMANYEWMANSLNPYNSVNNPNYPNNPNTFDLSNLIHHPDKSLPKMDEFGLIKNNYDKWLWGDDNTGNITTTTNIKKIAKDIRTTWLTKNERLNLIICDDSTMINNSSTDIFTMQKMELSQVISIIACSSIGGNCCVKHFIPYKHIDIYNSSNTNTLDSSIFFIGYLYMYFIAFDSMSLFKPNSSHPDNGEFYVICKGFNGINDKQLNNLYTILEHFTLNNTIIEKKHIPESFLKQINNFLEAMSNLNIVSIEKQNLLLTCYKNIGETDIKKYQQTNKILKCDNFFNKEKIDDMLIPKYREWIKIFNFK